MQPNKLGMDVTGILLDPKRFAVHDGPGIRTTFFLKGCPLHCIWCHNPESISPKPEMAFYQHKCVNCGECIPVCRNNSQVLLEGKHLFKHDLCLSCGDCEKSCLGYAMKLYGKRVSVKECLKIAIEDYEFYQNSNGGVTLSGGEPLLQNVFAISLLVALKQQNIHTALDTSCFIPQSVLADSLEFTDMYLVDFKHADTTQHKLLTGQGNELIRDNLSFLSKHGKHIEIRIPFVPGCNDSTDNMHETGVFLSSINVDRVRLLPYHSFARSKYLAISKKDTMPSVDSPTTEQLDSAVDILQKYGLNAIHS